MSDLQYQLDQAWERIKELAAENGRLRGDVEKYKDWCRKLIEAGKFPGEIGNPLN